MIRKNISQNGYSNCVEISNNDTSVLLEPDCGGRVMNFSLNGIDIIYKNPAENGYLLESGKNPHSNLSPCAGRCDIGPEMTTPTHPDLWLGRWETIVHNDFTVELVSKTDSNIGIQLKRWFTLNPESSELTFKQTIINNSNEIKNHFHWSRTFCNGGGIALAPVNNCSRFPKKYITYGPGDMIDYMPEAEENVIIEKGILQIIGTPQKAKFAMDLDKGWLAYLTKRDVLLIKRFEVFPDKVYGEIAANNMSFWYNEEEMCEVEPIGPVESILPGNEVSFIEKWFLFPYKYVSNQKIDEDSFMVLLNKT